MFHLTKVVLIATSISWMTSQATLAFGAVSLAVEHVRYSAESEDGYLKVRPSAIIGRLLALEGDQWRNQCESLSRSLENMRESIEKCQTTESGRHAFCQMVSLRVAGLVLRAKQPGEVGSSETPYGPLVRQWRLSFDGTTDRVTLRRAVAKKAAEVTGEQEGDIHVDLLRDQFDALNGVQTLHLQSRGVLGMLVSAKGLVLPAPLGDLVATADGKWQTADAISACEVLSGIAYSSFSISEVNIESEIPNRVASDDALWRLYERLKQDSAALWPRLKGIKKVLWAGYRIGEWRAELVRDQLAGDATVEPEGEDQLRRDMDVLAQVLFPFANTDEFALLPHASGRSISRAIPRRLENRRAILSVELGGSL